MRPKQWLLVLGLGWGVNVAVAWGAEPVILDVRTSAEYSEGHVKNALNIDVTSGDFEAKVSALEKTKAYKVYCRSGRRSQIAVDKMKVLGFKQADNIGGLSDALKVLSASCEGGASCPH